MNNKEMALKLHAELQGKLSVVSKRNSIRARSFRSSTRPESPSLA